MCDLAKHDILKAKNILHTKFKNSSMLNVTSFLQQTKSLICRGMNLCPGNKGTRSEHLYSYKHQNVDIFGLNFRTFFFRSLLIRVDIGDGSFAFLIRSDLDYTWLSWISETGETFRIPFS